MTRFRTRRMEAADEANFNNTYNMVVSDRRPPRSLEVMRKIWHEGPGGPVMSWLIEARDGADDWHLVGHHGLCPIRYTKGREDYLFAKTVNTFLLPEYRSKFLYPRFEQRCLTEVEQAFDATYSLTNAIARLRAAIGYDIGVVELNFERGLRGPEILSRLLLRLTWRYPALPLAHLVRWWSGTSVRRKSHLALEDLDGRSAIASDFFSGFWNEARLMAGLSPRRDRADLAWRFWNMPGERRRTLVYAGSRGESAYCIINQGVDRHFTLQDISLSVPRPGLLEDFLAAVFDWCAGRGGLMFSFMTTADSQPPSLLDIYLRNMGTSLSRRYRNQHMSRRLTARGRARLGDHWPPCNVTGILDVA